MDLPISKSEGEAFIKEYLRLQAELLKMEDIINSSDEILKKYQQTGVISFIFKKQRIDSLFQSYNDANALRIYYGAHNDGDPTLVVVPCMVSEDNKKADNKISGDGWRILQHPKPRTRSGGYGLIEFDLGNDPIN